MQKRAFVIYYCVFIINHHEIGLLCFSSFYISYIFITETAVDVILDFYKTFLCKLAVLYRYSGFEILTNFISSTESLSFFIICYTECFSLYIVFGVRTLFLFFSILV